MLRRGSGTGQGLRSDRVGTFGPITRAAPGRRVKASDRALGRHSPCEAKEPAMSTTHHEPRTEPVVIVGVDGSADSNKAVDWAARYAQRSGNELVLMSAWRYYDPYGVGLGATD